MANVKLTLGLLFAAFAALAEETHVFMYAQRDTPARSWLTVFCNDTPVAKIKKGRFFALALPAGSYTLGIGQGVPYPLTVQSARDQYIRVEWHHHMGRAPIPALSEVREEVARKEMRFLSYVEAKQIESQRVPPQDPRPAQDPQFRQRP
ncbi:hypothetical protein F183_A52180 [Bryobacterales bacterium F-183]|nr:hypothetical protein F183_A52180 [Bryobacterales bacterium F-183]